jgi:hypothetical protein
MSDPTVYLNGPGLNVHAWPGVPKSITFTYADAAGDPITGADFLVVVGGDADDVGPVPDEGDGVVYFEATEGPAGSYVVTISYPDSGSYNLRVVIDDEPELKGRLRVTSSARDGDASVSVPLQLSSGATVAVTVIGGGGGGGGGGLELGETSTTAYRGDHGKTAYDHARIGTGNPHGTTAADVGAAAVSHAHAIADVTGLQTALDGKAATSHNHSAADLTSGTLPAARIAGTATDGYVPKVVAGVPTWAAPSAPAIAHWYQTGDWSTLQGLTETIIGNGGTIAPGAGVLLLWRIMPVAPVQVSGCQFLTGTGGGGGSTARIGIFAATTGGPTGSPLCTSTAIDVSGTGITSETGWSPATLSAWTVYYGAIFSSSATWALRAMTAVGQNNVLNAALLEAPTPSAGAASGGYVQWRQSTSYGALPSIGTAVRTLGTISVPAIAWKVTPV